MATVSDIKQIAHWAIKRTRQLLKFSSNFPDPNHQLSHRALYLELARHRGSNPQQKKMIEELYNWHLDMSSEAERYPLNDSQLWLESFNKFMHFKSILGEIRALPTLKSRYKDKDELLLLEAIISKALKFGMGNCEELTAFTTMFLFEYNDLEGLPKLDKPVRIENVAFNVKFPNDHVFLILNRDFNSKLNDITSWNNDVVICDPWSQEVYTKTEFLEQMDLEAQTAMIEKFNTLHKNILTKDNYYIGEQYNTRIHTDHWNQKSDSKYWHPKKLIDLEAPQVMLESLPKMQKAAKGVKLSGNYPLDLIQNTHDIPEFFELFGGLQELYVLEMDRPQLNECLTHLQQNLDVKTFPYEYPLFLKISAGENEKCLIFYKNKWLGIEGKDRFVEENGNLNVLIKELSEFDGRQNSSEIKDNTGVSKNITLSISRATKDLNRTIARLESWYETYSYKKLCTVKKNRPAN